MKNLFKRTWFRVVFFGVIIGGLLIIFDNQFNLFGSEKTDSSIYDGPVSIEKDKVYFTEVRLSENKFDFGTVKEGDTLTHVFSLTNTGKEPLFIYKSSSSCDCVIAQFPTEMIKPGAEAEVKVYFNTKGRKGPQVRTMTLTCNTDPADIALTINAIVE